MVGPLALEMAGIVLGAAGAFVLLKLVTFNCIGSIVSTPPGSGPFNLPPCYPGIDPAWGGPLLGIGGVAGLVGRLFDPALRDRLPRIDRWGLVSLIFAGGLLESGITFSFGFGAWFPSVPGMTLLGVSVMLIGQGVYDCMSHRVPRRLRVRASPSTGAPVPRKSLVGHGSSLGSGLIAGGVAAVAFAVFVGLEWQVFLVQSCGSRPTFYCLNYTYFGISPLVVPPVLILAGVLVLAGGLTMGIPQSWSVTGLAWHGALLAASGALAEIAYRFAFAPWYGGAWTPFYLGFVLVCAGWCFVRGTPARRPGRGFREPVDC